jgi:hypothetical protein
MVGDTVVLCRTRWSPVRGTVTLTDSGIHAHRPIAVDWSYKGGPVFARGWHRPGNLEPAVPEEKPA